MLNKLFLLQLFTEEPNDFLSVGSTTFAPI